MISFRGVFICEKLFCCWILDSNRKNWMRIRRGGLWLIYIFDEGTII